MKDQEIYSLKELDVLAKKDNNCRNLVISIARKFGAPDSDYDLCYEFLLAVEENGDEEMILEDINFYKRLVAFNL